MFVVAVSNCQVARQKLPDTIIIPPPPHLFPSSVVDGNFLTLMTLVREVRTGVLYSLSRAKL